MRVIFAIVHLVERKTMEKKQNSFDNANRMTIITHSRSIDDRSYSYSVQGSLTEGQSQVVETQMNQEEVKKFKEDWRNLWKPQKEADILHFISLHFD